MHDRMLHICVYQDSAPFRTRFVNITFAIHSNPSSFYINKSTLGSIQGSSRANLLHDGLLVETVGAVGGPVGPLGRAGRIELHLLLLGDGLLGDNFGETL